MNKIDGIIFKQMIISGSNNLFNSYPEVDSLNVFPVPDGDTGTNMNLTMSSGLKEVANRNDKSISAIAKAFSRGLLMGARGNSGVILSQIFRGFSQGLEGKEEVDAIELSEAFNMGKDVAYKAVMHPVEGTILTVVRESAAALSAEAKDGMPIDKAIEIFYAEAQASLVRTPDLLPVLKEVGVVDSGGAGFCKIIQGFLLALKNKIVQKNMADVVEVNEPAMDGMKSGGNVQSKLEHQEFGYCTEFILKIPKAGNEEQVGKRPFNELRFKSVLNAHGNSIVEVKDDDLIKVHIHTKFPGNILSFAQQYGEFMKIKVENMTEQHTELLNEDNKEEKKEAVEAETKPLEEEKPVEETKPNQERKKYALIACCSGKGVEDIFRSQRIDQIVSGGQTMNPSTEDFVKAIKACNADNVFIFPNNGNIIMAASQAADVTTGCRVCVIPSKTIPQGIVASMMFNPEVEFEDNKSDMEGALDSVKTGQVTFAIRDSSVDGVEVKKGEYMGILEKKIVVSLPDKITAAQKLLKNMVDEMSSIITVIVGADVTEDEKQAFTDFISAKYGADIDIDIKDGGQPVYSFIIGVE
ncbi:MAG: DAK2 domain-containing protein [Bacilli bacterium]|jgi:DAK2 domain fusion protein YloV|nr:DAK2 domain-containing protein [Bacilli bacterium]